MLLMMTMQYPRRVKKTLNSKEAFPFVLIVSNTGHYLYFRHPRTPPRILPSAAALRLQSSTKSRERGEGPDPTRESSVIKTDLFQENCFSCASVSPTQSTKYDRTEHYYFLGPRWWLRGSVLAFEDWVKRTLGFLSLSVSVFSWTACLYHTYLPSFFLLNSYSKLCKVGESA